MAKVNRLETLVQRVAADIIQTEVRDNLGFLTVTDVKITNELSFMYIYYSQIGSEADLKHTAAALERAKGFIKNQIALRVKMRKIPELVFKFDDSGVKGRQVDEIIKKL